jgi:threonine/homoserine/homoserine lactone efflux protein
MNGLLLSMVGFAVAMYITPGPNNVMLASAGANHGVRATLPHMLGIAAGFSFMLMTVAAGLGALVLLWPPLLPVMRWVGAAWMLYLAWKIASAPAPGEGGRGRVLGVLGAAGFQWINPKAWLIALGAGSMFITPAQPLPLQVARIGLVFALVAFPCMLPWVLLGKGARHVLRSQSQLRAFNIGMAVLLVACLVPLLTER